MILPGIHSKTLFYEALRSRVDVPRDEVLEDIDKQLRKSGRFVALRGNSGGGKSYFLRHQLVPYYQEHVNEEADEQDAPWRVISFSPQINPIGMLANALASPGILKESRSIQPFFREQLEQDLRASNDGLVNIYRDAALESEGPFRLLIIVDQLEDMFQIGDELHKKRAAGNEVMDEFFQAGDDTLFFNLFLKALRTEIPVYILFSIGSESLDRLNAFQGWPERISINHYALPQITSVDVEKALYTSSSRQGERSLIIPEGLDGLYRQILKDYKGLSSEKKELPARVNIVLHQLYKHSFEILEKPFKHLKKPPTFITQALNEGKTPHRRAELIRARFLSPENQKVWEKRMAEMQLNEDERKAWELGVTEFYSNLHQHYLEIGGLKDAPDYYFNKIYSQFSEEEKALTSRLFQTITVKDTSPDVVAGSYAVPFSILREVCFRRGEEYLQILHMLGYGGGIEEEDPEAALKAQNELLQKVIFQYNFSGGVIPDMIRWVNPFGQLSGNHPPHLDEETLIKLGSSSLLQEWSMLKGWVDEEYAAANLYLKLAQDAQFHYDEEQENNTTSTEPRANVPVIPNLFFFNEVWAMITGFINEKIRRKKSPVLKTTHKPEKTLLSSGGVELAGKWFLNSLPSAAWGAKYRAEEIIIDAEGEKKAKFKAWVKDGAWTAFSLTSSFWKESFIHHENRRKNDEARTRQEIKKQKTRARWMGRIALLAAVFMAYAFYSHSKVTEKETKLRLLDFVDGMTKAELIPPNIYRWGAFKTLKDDIADKKIKEEAAVIDSMATLGILDFKDENPNSTLGQFSKTALLQLDELVDNYQNKEGKDNEQVLVDMTNSIIGTAVDAMAYNETVGDTNYQFPYVYQVLWENYGALKPALTSHADDQGLVYKSHARITSVESNPRVKDQYAVGDAAGQVSIIMDDDTTIVRLNSISESISSMLYDPSGRFLYASTFAGNIYRYYPLRDTVYDRSPVGLKGGLEIDKLTVEGRECGKGLAIISVHNTALEDHLLVVGDVVVNLIRRKENNDSIIYEAVQSMDLGKDLTALTITEGNEDGTRFIVGGSDASALLSFDPTETSNEKMSIVRIVDHDSTSVSAIAFENLDAFRARVKKNIGPTSQKVAIGTETGDIWITDLNSYSATGAEEAYLMKVINEKAVSKDTLNYQRSAISQLFFNNTRPDNNGIEQLISSSLDGTVWIFNLGVLPKKTSFFLEDKPDSGTWDHLRLSAGSRSINNICVVNSGRFVAVEHNTIHGWPTSLPELIRKVKELRKELKPESR